MWKSICQMIGTALFAGRLFRIGLTNLVIFGVLLGALSSCSRQGAGIVVYGGGQKVRDYRPVPALVTESHLIFKPKYPVFDVHCHFGVDLDVQQLIEAMDERGVRTIVNLNGGWGDLLDRNLSRYHAFDSDRFVIFCNLDFSRIDEPGYGETMAQFLTEAHAKGVRGLKIFKNLGLTVRDRSGKLVSVDDPRLDSVWARAGQLKMPVLIHTADPVAFFDPVDRFNERWMQLKRHPNWSFQGSQYPDRVELLEQRNRVIARHEKTTFIGAHMGNSAESLKSLGLLLAKYPNFHVDISGRVAELGRQPYSSRKFFIRFQDRILFGTDRYPGRLQQPRYRIYYRFLETLDEYFDYYDHPFPPAGEWKIYGIGLPDDVLKKIYYENANQIFVGN